MIATLRVLLVGLVLSAFSFITPSEATTDLADVGGVGGSPFRAMCPYGTFLSGIAGRAGAFVDRLQLVCAQVLGSPFRLDIGTVQPGTIGLSRGGHTFDKECPRGYGIRGTHWFMTRSDRPFLSHFDFDCASYEHPTDPTVRIALNTSTDEGCPAVSFICKFGVGLDWTFCPGDQFAVGLYGRSGDFVDRIGLVCGPRFESVCAGACHSPQDSRIARFSRLSRISDLPPRSRDWFRQSHWWLSDWWLSIVSGR
jgi:hypothetical protein